MTSRKVNCDILCADLRACELPLICALLFGDRSRAVEPAEHAAGRSEPLAGRRYNGGNPWRAARNVNRGRASRAARRGLAGRILPAGRRLVTPALYYASDNSMIK